MVLGDEEENRWSQVWEGEGDIEGKNGRGREREYLLDSEPMKNRGREINCGIWILDSIYHSCAECLEEIRCGVCVVVVAGVFIGGEADIVKCGHSRITPSTGSTRQEWFDSQIAGDVVGDVAGDVVRYVLWYVVGYVLR